MKTLVLLIGCLAVGGLWWQTRPQQLLGSSVTSLGERSPAQRHNIEQAARSLHGRILRPGQEISFNALVGPRTRQRGYVAAPAFMTASTVASIGGGICQVSSALYGAALQAGLDILERHPHYTPVASVPPGLDATVWYGQADLRLRNPYPWPLRITTTTDATTLTLRLHGRRAPPLPPLTRRENHRDPQHLVVNVYRGNHQISSDTYTLPPSPANF
ncbi:MAG: VanW family protein [Thermostichales cyanobacterium SRBZ-1_bins_19]